MLKRKPLSVTLPEALHAQLAREADARLVNPSLIVEKALGAYLAALPPIPATNGDGAQ